MNTTNFSLWKHNPMTDSLISYGEENSSNLEKNYTWISQAVFPCDL